ncbi:hypothetical protein ACTWPT_04690 [Nonomuraea sp. 3N208]|uniref:hypothetical protein n=1 Tax=Nonomuraea sp. 3N208 TaxID=3457421 RepID=UPI003FCC7257
MADIFSAATGTLTVWNSEGGNQFGPATAISSGWTVLAVLPRHRAYRCPANVYNEVSVWLSSARVMSHHRGHG